VQATRELIMAAAERLFAEHGIAAVSSRQIAEAAGQGNTAVVGYHFGTKEGLIRAIFQRHSEEIEVIRARLASSVAKSSGPRPPDARDPGPRAPSLRDWVDCLVRPSTEHLAALGSPTWFARFGAQLMTDPVLRVTVLFDEVLGSPAMRRILPALKRCLSGLPDNVRREREDMARQLIVHVIAQRERDLADGRPTPRATWDDAATGLVDAIVGLYTAPVTSGEGRR